MIFRAYDIRGTVGHDLTLEIAEKIGQALGSEMFLQGANHIMVGYDNRPSSPDLAAALMRGVRASGLDTTEIGEVATPMLYYASVRNGACPAVMVTGSHLPPDQNGFKITQGTTPFFDENIQKLRQRIEQGNLISNTSGEIGQHFNEPYAVLKYLNDLQGRFGKAEKPLKIVVDAGNGMAGAYAPALLRHFGHEVIELYCDSDGTYPNHPADPTEEENLADLKKTVIAHDADLGLAFDGDADRMGAVDHTGQSHATDRLMIPLIQDMLRRKSALLKGVIVVDPLVSQVLIDTIKQAGGVPEMWKSGHSNIKSRMKQTGALCGVETSGHVFIADHYYGFDDGIYTALRLVDLLVRQNRSLYDLIRVIPTLFTTPQYRPTCPDDQKQVIVEAVRDHFARYEINTVDGIRVTLPDGWFILRASNTEPKLSLRFEAISQSALDNIVSEVAEVLKKHHINFL